MNDSNLTVGEIDGGRLILHINREIEKVVRDIADPNKQPKKKREVVVKIAFAPSQSRRDAEVSYTVTAKPAPHVESKTTVYLGKNSQGEIIAKPWVPDQPAFPEVEQVLEEQEEECLS